MLFSAGARKKGERQFCPAPIGLGLEPQHQVHVLHGGARRALAEIIELRDEIGLAFALRAKYVEPHRVAPVQRFRVKPGQGAAFLKLNYFDNVLPGIMGDKSGMDGVNARALRQHAEMQGDLHQHSLRKPADGRGEYWALRQQPVLRHLGHMLVLQRQAVEEVRRGDMVRVSRIFHLGDHLLAAAGIA